MSEPDQIHELSQRCDLCRESVRDRLAQFDRRLLALEIVVRGEDGHNGMKSQLSKLCDRFDASRKRQSVSLPSARRYRGLLWQSWRC